MTSQKPVYISDYFNIDKAKLNKFGVFDPILNYDTKVFVEPLLLKESKNPPGNRLETLKGNRIGQMSIRINNQWRICFVWEDAEAHDVEIVDYH